MPYTHMAVFTKRTPRWVNSTFQPSYAGTHITGDFWGCKLINSKEQIEEILHKAATLAGSTPLQASVYAFEPQGITGVILLAESHISIHTWPEIGFVAVDVFTCGAHTEPLKAVEYLQEVFGAKEVEIRTITRGEKLGKRNNNGLQ